MDLRLFRYFARVADLGTFGRAASELGVAQPALSRAVQKLERSLGAVLFERTPRGVILSDAGRRLRPRVGHILEAVDAAKADARSTNAGLKGTITIGLPPSLGAGIAPQLLTGLRLAHPRLQLRVVESYGGDIQDMLLSGRVDLGVLNARTVGRTQLSIEFLKQDRMYLLRRGRHTGTRRRIALTSLAGEPLILPTPEHGLRILIDDAARNKGVELQPLYEVDSIPVVLELLHRGAASAVLPLTVFRRELERGDLNATLISDPSIRRDLVLAVSNKRQPSRALAAVMQALKSAIDSA
jgi:LysR family nitrogen assimilation transcriptional regulator